MKRSCAFIFLGLAFALSAYAGPQAVLSGLKGKVEVKAEKGDWKPATEGMKINLRSTISTGFDSTATILIEKSKIVVKPLTRLTLDKLLEQSAGSVAASLFLRVGSVQASVKATVPGTPQDFKVQSPYSTASVRGTEFEYDGFFLKVTEGVVRLIPGRPVRETQSEGATGGGSESGSTQEGTGQDSQTGGTGSTQGGDSGFSGAADVDNADSNGGVNVHSDEQAIMQLAHRLDTGSTIPTVTGQTGGPGSSGSGSGNSGGGSGTTPVIVKSGGVVITITTKK
jgi:hypothetical protein